ncbi:MAG: cobalamin-dependent protein [Candidatus Methanomethylophilaceae archaeon]|jgi:methanogenic corrinoid protein MtbC1
MDKQALLKELADAVIACDPERAKKAAEEALKEKLDPVEAINEGLVVGMGVIGDNYAERKMYLPQVLVAAHSMYEGLDVLLPAIPKGDLSDAKTAETAVVQGDVHDIGKNIVKTMLTASGYIVEDLGKDVDPEIICKNANDKGIDVVCISTLMTPTMDNMERAVKLIRASKVADSTIVTIGGPPTSESFAEEIGADHRDENAQQCVKFVNHKMEENKKKGAN